MAIDPKKLMALAQRENAVKPFQEEAPAAEAEAEMEGEGEEGEGEEEIIELTEQEIEAIAQMIEDGEGEPDLMELADQLVEEMEAAEEEGVELESPPAWVASPAIWEKAEQAVDPEDKGSKYTEPYAVLVHVYNRMGGTVV